MTNAQNIEMTPEVEVRGGYQFEIGRRKYEASSSGIVDLIDHTGYARQPNLRPDGLDAIEPGKYTIQEVLNNPDPLEDTVLVPKRYDIQIEPTETGRLVSVESFGAEGWRAVHGDTSDLMIRLGYAVDTDGDRPNIVGVPSPERAKSFAADVGVNIELFPGQGMLLSKEYLGSFRDGKYPVSTGTELYYQHDLSDDHLTALVLGGEPIRDELMRVAERALKEDESVQNKVTAGIDSFTATLRAVIAPHPELLGEAYGRQNGRATFHEAANEIGISAEAAELILKTAQSRAREFEIEPAVLD